MKGELYVKMKNYTLEEIIEMYKEEYPEWTDQKVISKARKFHRQIERYDRKQRRKNKLFYDKEVPTGLLGV